jgi:hypothetical protein
VADWNGDGEIHLKEFKKIFVLMALRCPCNDRTAQLYAQNIKKEPYKHTVVPIANQTMAMAMGALWERLNMQVHFFSWIFEGVLVGNYELSDFFENLEHLRNPATIKPNTV